MLLLAAASHFGLAPFSPHDDVGMTAAQAVRRRPEHGFALRVRDFAHFRPGPLTHGYFPTMFSHASGDVKYIDGAGLGRESSAPILHAAAAAASRSRRATADA